MVVEKMMSYTTDLMQGFRSNGDSIGGVVQMTSLCDGVRAFQQRDYETADRICKMLLEEDPSDCGANNLRGLLLAEAGDFERASTWIEKATRLAPGHREFRRNLAQMYLASGRYGECIAAVEEVEGWKEDAEVLALRGSAHYQCNEYSEALRYFRDSLSRDSEQALVWSQLGRTLCALEKYDEADTALRKAILLIEGGGKHDTEDKEQHRSTAFLIAEVAEERSDPDLAIQILERLLEEREDVEYLRLKGRCLFRQGRYAAAYATLKKPVSAGEMSPSILGEFANSAMHLGKYEEAEVYYREALSQDPGNRSLSFNLALLLLSARQFEEGFELYEQRDFADAHERFAAGIPCWNGEPGRRLLVYPEQGLGDCIQFVRYLREVSEQCEKVAFVVPPPLHSLLVKSAKDLSVDFVHADEFENNSGSLEYDAAVSLMSVPYLLSVDHGKLGHMRGGYLKELPSRSSRGRTDRIRLGLCWRGNPNHKLDGDRSIALAEIMAHLGNLPDVEFVSLQKEHGRDELAGYPIQDIGQSLSTFEDTARVIPELDVVVSVDTAVAHLCGALGQEVYVLLPHVPDWRWFRARSGGCPWYASAQLFGQAYPKDWSDPLVRVREHLFEVRREK